MCIGPLARQLIRAFINPACLTMISAPSAELAPQFPIVIPAYKRAFLWPGRIGSHSRTIASASRDPGVCIKRNSLLKGRPGRARHSKHSKMRTQTTQTSQVCRGRQLYPSADPTRMCQHATSVNVACLYTIYIYIYCVLWSLSDRPKESRRSFVDWTTPFVPRCERQNTCHRCFHACR